MGKGPKLCHSEVAFYNIDFELLRNKAVRTFDPPPLSCPREIQSAEPASGRAQNIPLRLIELSMDNKRASRRCLLARYALWSIVLSHLARILLLRVFSSSSDTFKSPVLTADI